jgi:PucR C-terminal helix-turn-helix domain
VTSVVDVWRAADPEARHVSGATEALGRALRGVQRSRASAPHISVSPEGHLLVVDGLLGRRTLEELLALLGGADAMPAALVVAGGEVARLEPVDDPLPVLSSQLPASLLADRARTYLEDETAALARLSAELRLACAEAALAEPDPSAPAGLIAARLRRGVAVAVDGALHSVHARPAGRALAARFAAIHARLLSGGEAQRAESLRRHDGLVLIERRVQPGASVWLFDDLPFAAVDEVAVDALTLTLRALLRRPHPRSTARLTSPAGAEGRPAVRPTAASPTDPLDATLLAVARANGRVAVAARALGVHRNTVLYRLRQARAARGIDPRRPEDALRILAEAEREAGRSG